VQHLDTSLQPEVYNINTNDAEREDVDTIEQFAADVIDPDATEAAIDLANDWASDFVQSGQDVDLNPDDYETAGDSTYHEGFLADTATNNVGVGFEASEMHQDSFNIAYDLHDIDSEQAYDADDQSYAAADANVLDDTNPSHMTLGESGHEDFESSIDAEQGDHANPDDEINYDDEEEEDDDEDESSVSISSNVIKRPRDEPAEPTSEEAQGEWPAYHFLKSSNANLLQVINGFVQSNDAFLVLLDINMVFRCYLELYPLRLPIG